MYTVSFKLKEQALDSIMRFMQGLPEGEWVKGHMVQTWVLGPYESLRVSEHQDMEADLSIRVTGVFKDEKTFKDAWERIGIPDRLVLAK